MKKKMITPDIFHKHLIVRSEVKNPLIDVYETNEWLKKLVHVLNMEILMGPFSVYCNDVNNEGITGLVAIKTSHIAIHIWDKIDPAIVQLDVYTCSSLDEHVIFSLMNGMYPLKIEWKYLDRKNGLNFVNSGYFEFEK